MKKETQEAAEFDYFEAHLLMQNQANKVSQVGTGLCARGGLGPLSYTSLRSTGHTQLFKWMASTSSPPSSPSLDRGTVEV